MNAWTRSVTLSFALLGALIASSVPARAQGFGKKESDLTNLGVIGARGDESGAVVNYVLIMTLERDKLPYLLGGKDRGGKTSSKKRVRTGSGGK